MKKLSSIFLVAALFALSLFCSNLFAEDGGGGSAGTGGGATAYRCIENAIKSSEGLQQLTEILASACQIGEQNTSLGYRTIDDLKKMQREGTLLNYLFLIGINNFPINRPVKQVSDGAA